MNKIRLFFLFFSMLVLAGTANAQRRDRGRDQSGIGGIIFGNDRVRHGDDDDDDDDDRRGRIGNRRHDDDDQGDDEEDGEDRGGGIGRNRGCIDQNGRNVCDVAFPGRLPNRLPDMINAILISRGQLTPDGRTWLGSTHMTPRYIRGPGRSYPSKVTWLNRAGQIGQVWFDRNGDGRADMVKLYRRGRLLRTVRR